MKKNLVAMAVLGSFAGMTAAADLTLYGVVDYGMLYQHAELENMEGTETFDNYDLASGVNAASRFGLKGTEDLGNGYSVSFKLENGFDADDGSFSDDDRLFNREARLTIATPWGELSAGRMGAVGSSSGTYDTVFAIGDAFDGGDNLIYTGVMTDRYDNMLTYRSPKVSGLQLSAQYSLKTGGDHGVTEVEGHSSAQRYASLALTGEYGALQTVLAYEQTLYSAADEYVPDDAKIISLGGNFDFGVAKVFAMGQYFEDTRDFKAFDVTTNEAVVSTFDFADGYSAHLGVQMPLSAGTLTAGIYYADAEYNYFGESDTDAKSYAGSVKYEYPLSARTSLYGSLGYGKLKYEYSYPMDTVKTELDVTQAYVGVTHTF